MPNIFAQAMNKGGLLQSSFLGDADTPSYTVLSQGLDDGDSSGLQLSMGDEKTNGFDNSRPLYAPNAENSAQRWDRQANSLMNFSIEDNDPFGLYKRYQNTHVMDESDPLRPQGEQTTHLIDENDPFNSFGATGIGTMSSNLAFGANADPRLTKWHEDQNNLWDWEKGQGMTSFVSADEWQKKQQQAQQLQKANQPQSLRDHLLKGNDGNPVLDESKYAGRQNMQTIFGMSGNDYLNHYGRINTATRNTYAF